MYAYICMHIDVTIRHLGKTFCKKTFAIWVGLGLTLFYMHTF